MTQALYNDGYHSFDDIRRMLCISRVYCTTGHLRSLSFTQIPDIAVECRYGSDQYRVAVFDPEYKLTSELNGTADSRGQAVKVDIDKMHAYRDAIRDQTGQRVVDLAAVLYPGDGRVFADGLEAIQADPQRVGALKLHLHPLLTQLLMAI